MTRVKRWALAVAALAVSVPAVQAQNAAESAPLNLSDFVLSGTATGGYRFETVKGYAPQFQEMFDLGKGFRLLDFDLIGDAKEMKNPFADHFSLQATSLGGDPFPTAQFAISKNKLYDFRADWRESYYYWNQNDNVALPIVATAPTLSTGLTDNHNWATVRKFGSANFTLHATNRLRFQFGYDRASDEGTAITTEAPDFFGSPGFWGTYVRANPFSLLAPLSDYTNRFSGGIDYSLRDWSFHYKIGYQIFTEASNWTNLTSPELSIDPVASSKTEPLANFTSANERRLTTPISEFSFVGKPLPKLEWRGGYSFYRYKGPVAFDQEFNGTAPSSTGPLAAYTVSESARALVTEPTHVFTQGLAYHVYRWWSLNADYKYSRFTSNSTGTYQSLFNGTTPMAGTTNTVWRDGLSDLTLQTDFTPMHGLVIRAGVQFMKSDVESLTNGVGVPALTLSTKTARPAVSFGYEPSKKISFRGDFHTLDNGSSYTAITPHTEQGGRVSVRYRPMENLSIEDEGVFSSGRYLTTNFQNSVRSNAITASYSLGERLSVFGGFSYDSYYAQGNIDYARGTAPLTDFLRDQELTRVWSGGIEGKPTKRSGIRLSGNYDHSTGVGAVLGVPFASTPATYNEPPAYGPFTWPLITLTAYYDVPVAGRIGLDLQRTYYVEQIVTVNNFSANLLTIRWTKAF
jgi:hypothetical protein